MRARVCVYVYDAYSCPAKIKLDTLKDVSVSSAIDQDASMLSEDVIQSGYVVRGQGCCCDEVLCSSK